MRTRNTLATVLFLSMVGLRGSEADASCCVVPCWDCVLEQEAQVTLVSIDRARSEIEMVPNIRFSGEAERFALVVPTPSEPRFAPAESQIWNDLWLLTAPTATRRSGSSEGFGCGQTDYATDAGDPQNEDDVRVLSEVRVGAFLATVVQSDSTRALLEWLNDRGYGFTEADQVHVEPLVRAGWVFTAMELDTTVVQAPSRWDHSVDPVAITFSADRFDIPLGFISINRGARLQMIYFVLDDHRVAIDGFDVTYANRISSSESAAIRQRYPRLERYAAGGRFLTRLDTSFASFQSMEGLRVMERASNDDEFRRTWAFGAVVPVDGPLQGGGVSVGQSPHGSGVSADPLHGARVPVGHSGEGSTRSNAARLATALSNSIPGQLLFWLLLLVPLQKRLVGRKVR